MKTLGCFVLRFAVLFALLVCPWPGVRSTVSAGLRTQIRLLLGAMLPRQSFRVETYSDPRHANLDTLVVMADHKNAGSPGGQPAVGITFDSSSQVWMPFAMLIALTLAAPLPWPNRCKAPLVGGLVVQLMVVATIWVSVSLAFTSEASPAWPRLPLMLANHLLVENIWFSFVPPFLFWVGWLGWGGHWERLGARCLASAGS
jgi:hypothetical protein